MKRPNSVEEKYLERSEFRANPLDVNRRDGRFSEHFYEILPKPKVFSPEIEIYLGERWVAQSVVVGAVMVGGGVVILAEVLSGGRVHVHSLPVVGKKRLEN
ncbi:hypothetical protein LSTR_LSTR005321 [Laodelphax striatellus]|uniref:Uncharacterized protein n=1 Tax=Laodelphax striatellus TaxID=195883 RepID=A0A482X7I6_LAOST|nr:hypothetical protein LSTR_LSTR005321 [Laodelphax striatellus]